MATGKKPSPAQLRARAAFVKMVKERAKLRAAGKLPPVKRKAKAATGKVKRKVGKPSPAQLAARAKFAAMVRARSKAAKGKTKTNSRGFSTRPPSWVGSKKKATKKKNPAASHAQRRHALKSSSITSTWSLGKGSKATRRAKKLGKTFSVFAKSAFKKGGKVRLPNPAILRLTEAQAKAYSGKIKGLGAPTRTARTRSVTSAPRKKATKRFKKVGVFGGSGFLGLGRSIQTIKRNNPGLFARLKGLITSGAKKKPARVGYRKTQRGKYRPTRYMERKSLSHGRPVVRYANPAPASVFSEFRGKSVTRKTKLEAASGTPSTLAQLGKLRELKLRGKVLRFKAGHLAADGRKKLHIVGIKAKDKHNPGSEVDYGEIISVTYEADKPHIESGELNYIHKFGEEGGTRPHLVVDPEGFMKIEGGSYGITSDGIID